MRKRMLLNGLIALVLMAMLLSGCATKSNNIILPDYSDAHYLCVADALDKYQTAIESNTQPPEMNKCVADTLVDWVVITE